MVALLDENGSPFAAYRYDAWGNPSGNVEASEVRYEEGEDLLDYEGSWTTAYETQASGGSYVYVNETGASVTIQFEGTHLTWITGTSADYGIAKVTLDGGTPAYVDLYSESTLYQQEVWDTGTPLDEDTHTVLIEWTGSKNESSTGTSISMDAIDITGVSGTGNVSTGVWAQETLDSEEAIVISEALATDIAQRQVLRYAGYCYDSESGMYYLSARHYDPVTRQFLSKDLSRNDGEQSAYQYCLGNPVGLVDPSGLRTESAYEKTDWAAWGRAYAAASRRIQALLKALKTAYLPPAAAAKKTTVRNPAVTKAVVPPGIPASHGIDWDLGEGNPADLTGAGLSLGRGIGVALFPVAPYVSVAIQLGGAAGSITSGDFGYDDAVLTGAGLAVTCGVATGILAPATAVVAGVAIGVYYLGKWLFGSDDSASAPSPTLSGDCGPEGQVYA